MSALRVAYAGHDFFSSCLMTLIARPDVEVVLCLTNDPRPNNQNVRAICAEARIPMIIGRLDGDSIAEFNDGRIGLLVCAAYLYRIPVEKLSVSWAINIHPSLLPEGRGPNPLPYLIDERPDVCGLGLHQLTPEFDRGPLLLKERIELDENEGSDELYLKMFSEAPRLLERFLRDIDGAFARKEEQGLGSYWPEHTREQQTVDTTTATIQDVTVAHRKFGMFGILLRLLDGRTIEAKRLTAARCEHVHPSGMVVATLQTGWIISMSDGLVRIDAPG